MTHVYVYFAVQALVTLHALMRGGAPERWVGVLIAAGGVLTAAFPNHAFVRVALSNVAIDLVCFLALLAVALWANRFWPIWVAALQLLALGLHAVRVIDPDVLPIVYAWSSGKLVYPMLTMLAAGTVRHRRRGAEANWSWELARDEQPNDAPRGPAERG